MRFNPLLEILRQHWELFSEKYQKVFRYLLRMFQNKDHVYPGHARIADKIDASVKTVGNALRLFKELGLFYWEKRGHRSNLYIFDNIFREIDADDIDGFLRTLRDDCRSNCRLYNEASKVDIHVHALPAAHEPKSSDKKQQQPPLSFEDLPHMLNQPFMRSFDFEKYGWQIKLLPEVGQQEIITDMRWYALEQAKQGKPVKDMVTWCKIFTSMMKKWIFKNGNETKKEAYV
ncbi:MAG: hypothetical protein A3F13_02795 [Gammaproteobacteria bacterium RIFCSPHIGHO2_12_FULL_40_19]|nr:MAG: hypothetical protein A3F13_02795 [Gammaproteobacteria bacterium RIFCSPHIGHO2_12_FULL_40_19]